MDRKDRKQMILNMIEERKNNNEKPMPCIFQITVPRYLEESNLEDEEKVKLLTKLFDKYNIGWKCVDTIGGAYNLNREWIETSDILCYIEYCGAYPTEWDIDDVVTLEKMDYDGSIMIRVLWHPEEGKYIPNN